MYITSDEENQKELAKQQRFSNIMEYTKQKDIPGVAVFLDFEKAFGSVEWDYFQKCLEVANLIWPSSLDLPVGLCFSSRYLQLCFKQ